MSTHSLPKGAELGRTDESFPFNANAKSGKVRPQRGRLRRDKPRSHATPHVTL